MPALSKKYTQQKIFKYVDSYLKSLKKKNINISNSSFCYLHNYGQLPGSAHLRLKFYGYRYLLKYLSIIFKNIFAICKLKNFRLYNEKNLNNTYSNLIHSHVSKNNFNKDGSYNDIFFNINSNKIKKTLFFLISEDNFIPKKLKKNIVIFASSEPFFQLNIIYFFYELCKTIIKLRFSLRKLLHEFSYISQYSLKLNNEINFIFKKYNLKLFLSLYEGQPYQNNLFYKLKKKYKNLKIYGYYHTGLLATHSSMYYRTGAPDKILISGNFQKNYLEKNLGWPKEKVQSIVSFRHKKERKVDFSGYIFLPMNFTEPQKILSGLEKYFKHSRKKSLFTYKIRNHPYASIFKSHKKLIKKIILLMKKYKNKFSTKRNKTNSIFIGSTTSLILAMEHDIETIHICEDSFFDHYNYKIWDKFKTVKISSNVYKHKLKPNQHILNLESKYNNVRKYLKK